MLRGCATGQKLLGGYAAAAASQQRCRMGERRGGGETQQSLALSSESTGRPFLTVHELTLGQCLKSNPYKPFRDITQSDPAFSYMEPIWNP